jgi:hypothetical protein
MHSVSAGITAPLSEAVSSSCSEVTVDPSRLAVFRLGPERLVPRRLASYRLAPRNVAPLRSAACSLALARSASSRLAPLKSAPRRSLSLRSTPLKLRCALPKCDDLPGQAPLATYPRALVKYGPMAVFWTAVRSVSRTQRATATVRTHAFDKLLCHPVQPNSKGRRRLYLCSRAPGSCGRQIKGRSVPCNRRMTRTARLRYSIAA